MSDKAAQNEWLQRVLAVSVGSVSPPDPGRTREDGPLVAYRKALLGFQKARSDVKAQLSGLAGTLKQRLPQEATLADALSKDVEAFCENLQDTIDSGLNALGDAKQERIHQIRDEIEDLIGTVSNNRLIAHIDGNPIQPTTVAKTLVKALARVADTVN